jgi:outer membrane protein OmpA-like peptidoglycan-associated protein
MKTIRIKLLVGLAMLAVAAQAQNKPYTLGVSTHFLNFNTDKYLPKENWISNWGPTKISVGIPMTEKLAIMPTVSFGKGNAPGLNQERTFWNADANLKYNLTTTRLQPYAMVGGGATRLNEITYAGANAGLGLNFWIHELVALNAQTNYNLIPSHKYFQNSIGLVLKLDSSPGDRDKDGVPDDEDACPKVKGTAAANGCPDADGDGVKDDDDACPNEAGTLATRGCPDSDGDGIVNAQDNCPTQAGTTQFNGCPDSDGDGIMDKDDACPSEKGLASLKGCADRDGDGIADKDDACPDQKGTAALQGCPDRDGDSIADKDDQCPEVAGVASKNGCPEIKEEEKQQIESKLNIAAKKIQFETGSAKIKQASFSEIDQIVEIMKEYTFTKFDIEGHTDNTGKAESNKSLSQQRADAVKAYIASHGIANDRLLAVGYGSDKPLAPNTTAAGRTQNRRVEIHLMQ